MTHFCLARYIVCGDYRLFIIGKNVNTTMHSRRQNVALPVDYLSYTNEMTRWRYIDYLLIYTTARTFPIFCCCIWLLLLFILCSCWFLVSMMMNLVYPFRWIIFACEEGTVAQKEPPPSIKPSVLLAILCAGIRAALLHVAIYISKTGLLLFKSSLSINDYWFFFYMRVQSSKARDFLYWWWTVGGGYKENPQNPLAVVIFSLSLFVSCNEPQWCWNQFIIDDIEFIQYR